MPKTTRTYMLDYLIITSKMYEYTTKAIADFFNSYQILILYIIVFLFVISTVEIFMIVDFFNILIKIVWTIPT